MKRGIKSILLVLLLSIGISAAYSGFEMVIRPDGSSLGLSTSYLNPNYFTDFSIPGVVLLLAIGFISITLFVMILLGLQKFKRLLAIEGFILMSYIFVQLGIGIPFSLLHGICILIASIFIYIGLSSSIKVH